MILTWGKQERPAGLSTLEQVRELRDQAAAAAENAAADAVAEAQLDLNGKIAEAETARSAAETAQAAAESARLTAELARAEAETFATASGSAAQFFDTIAGGRAAVLDGETFGVRAGGADGLARPTIFRRDNGTTQTLVVSILSAGDLDEAIGAQNGRIAEVDDRTAGLHNTAEEAPFELTDEAGNVFHRINSDFETEFFGGSRLDGREHDWPFAFTDADGNVLGGYVDGAWHFPGLSASSDSGELDRLDQRNRDRSLAIMSQPRIGVQLPVTDTSIIAMLGQSLGEGNETWPSLSKSPVPGTLMMGDNVDSTTAMNSYSVVGTLALKPLVASTLSTSGTILSDAEEAALPRGSQVKGEPPVIGLVRGLKDWRNRRALAVNDGHNIIALNPAIAGKTIEELSKVSSDGVNRYALYSDGVGKAVSLAPGATIPVLGFAQGEYNYAVGFGGDTTRAGYRAKLSAYFDDVSADALALVPQQSEPPLIVTYQTGANYTVDLDANGQPGLAVGMAQLDIALSDPRVVMAGPAYPYTDKGGHLDSNGSRWMGHHFARAAREVWAGRNFQPTRPLEIVADGADIYLHYHVPVPPLVFATPYVISVPTDYAAKGYRVTSADGATAYAVQGVEIIRPTIIRLTLESAPPANALVWYASKSGSNGNGNVRDSDPSVAADRYEYVPERGMYAAANIPALVDRPYPLHNWSVAFCLPITYSEF